MVTQITPIQCAICHKEFQTGKDRHIYLLHLYIWGWYVCEKDRDKVKASIDQLIGLPAL